MTKREWKIGDLAVVTTKSGVQYRGIYQLAPGIDHYWGRLPGEVRPNALLDPDVSARPLVVIDPEDREQVERLLECVLDTDLGDGEAVEDEDVTEMQRALREFANPTPPKPEEPRGLGAVVEDADGNRWVRADQKVSERFPWIKWRGATGNWEKYADIDAVKILSDGVSDGS